MHFAVAALVGMTLLLAPAPSRAECYPTGVDSVSFAPECPTLTDSVTVRVDGWYPNGCWAPMELDSAHVAGDEVHMYATTYHNGYSFCPMVIVGFSFETRIAPLPAGTHPVTLWVNIVPRVDSSEFEGTYMCTSEIKVYTPGDLDASGSRTVSDIIALIIHLFKGGPVPACNSGDVNCDGKLTAADLIVYIVYTFRSGILPNHCGP